MLAVEGCGFICKIAAGRGRPDLARDKWRLGYRGVALQALSS